MPTSGWLDHGKHHLPVRVYYEDTDAGGIVYHASYLRYAERARSEFLRFLSRVDDIFKPDGGQLFVLRRLEIEYFRPAKLDDALLVVSHPTLIEGASITFQQSIMRDNIEIARLSPKCVLVSKLGRPLRIPRALNRALENLPGIS